MRLLSLVLPLLMSCSSLMGATVFRYLDCWTLYGDYLHLQPSVGSPYFLEYYDAVEPQPEMIANRPDFNSAWRVGFNYDMEDFCGVLGANYMQFSETKKTTIVVADTDVFKNFYVFKQAYDNGGTNISEAQFLLRQGEIFLKYFPCSYGDFFINAQMGLEIAYIRWNERDEIIPLDQGTGRLIQQSVAQCVGPQAGLGGDYELFCFCKGTHSLSLTGQFLGSLLAAHMSPSSTLRIRDSTTDIQNSFQKLSRVVPSWQLRLGLRAF